MGPRNAEILLPFWPAALQSNHDHQLNVRRLLAAITS